MNKEQKRQQADEQWRLRFNEAGLSEYFEFLGRGYGRSQRKLSFVKCKSCNFEFSTYNVDAVLRKRARTMCCPECGMKSDGTVQWTKSKIYDEVFDYYLQGHTANEVSEKFGITIVQFDNERKIRGITKSEEQRKQSWSASLKKASKNGHETQKMRARQNRIARLDSLGFDYVSESDKKGRVRCRKCGFEFERTFQNLRCGNVTCSECMKIRKTEEEQARKKEQEERKAKQEERKAKQEAERIAKNPLGLSYYQLSIQEKYDVVRVCEVCGNEYTIRDRMTKEGLKYCTDSGCCSNFCTKKRARIKRRAGGFRDNHRYRAKIYGCEYDGSITLRKLIRRDGLRCAICGEMCDPNDHTWTSYNGPKHPTIDHIIPMSKGGGHVWGNVQVAHAICNSTKGAQYEQG